ncbi:hypothetical protein EDC04DRAFT_2650114, partial [Pisolithus marmoratus]
MASSTGSMLAMLVASVVVVSAVQNSFFVNITCPIVLALYSFCVSPNFVSLTDYWLKGHESARFIIHTRETISQPASLQSVEELSLSILSL